MKYFALIVVALMLMVVPAFAGPGGPGGGDPKPDATVTGGTSGGSYIGIFAGGAGSVYTGDFKLKGAGSVDLSGGSESYRTFNTVGTVSGISVKVKK